MENNEQLILKSYKNVITDMNLSELLLLKSGLLTKQVFKRVLGGYYSVNWGKCDINLIMNLISTYDYDFEILKRYPQRKAGNKIENSK